jgi:hypothetical protein
LKYGVYYGKILPESTGIDLEFSKIKLWRDYMHKVVYTEKEKLMLKLSFIAYLSLVGDTEFIEKGIRRMISHVKPAQNLVWGPAVGSEGAIVNYALMYIVQDHANLDEYTVVIRGTNPLSSYSWISQDLDVGQKVPWNKISEYSPDTGAMISNATNTAMEIHTSLKYPEGASFSKTFFEFLRDIVMKGKKLTINFTGHSLGGLLAPTLALWFYDMMGTPDLKDFRDNISIKVYGFAGPTAGDNKFAEYSDSILKAPSFFRSFTRYINKLDVAVNVWNKDDMKNILSFYGDDVPITKFIKNMVELFIRKLSKLKYTQPGQIVVINSHEEKFKIPDLKGIDLDAELGLEGKYSLNAYYKNNLADMGINEENIAMDIEGTALWFLMAVYQHVFPYLFSILGKNDVELITNEIIIPLINKTFPGEKIKNALLEIIKQAK